MAKLVKSHVRSGPPSDKILVVRTMLKTHTLVVPSISRNLIAGKNENLRGRNEDHSSNFCFLDKRHLEIPDNRHGKEE